MGVFEEAYSYNLQPDNIVQVAEMENMDRMREKRKHLLEQQTRNDSRRKQLDEFKSQTYDFLVSEAMVHILEKCIPQLNSTFKSQLRNICTSFVNEETSYKLVNSFRTKTLFLSELASIIEESQKQIIHGCEGKDGPFKISNSDINKFYNKLDNITDNQITKEISSRVAKAEEEFIKNNINDKKELEDLASSTKEKLDSIKNDDSDLENKLKQECTALYKRKVDSIMKRKKGILESIVLRMSNGIITEESMLSSYTKENGKLDMQKIIESSEIMYAFLEMVNTLKIKKVDNNYIKNTLDSIQ